MQKWKSTGKRKLMGNRKINGKIEYQWIQWKSMEKMKIDGKVENQWKRMGKIKIGGKMKIIDKKWESIEQNEESKGIDGKSIFLELVRNVEITFFFAVIC